MPPDAIYVGRGSKWGNPFKIEGVHIYAFYHSAWHPYKIDSAYTASDVVQLFHDLLFDLNSHKIEPEIYNRFRYMRDRILDLKGEQLACWCKEGTCCHADALIELANS